MEFNHNKQGQRRILTADKSRKMQHSVMVMQLTLYSFAVEL